MGINIIADTDFRLTDPRDLADIADICRTFGVIVISDAKYFTSPFPIGTTRLLWVG